MLENDEFENANSNIVLASEILPDILTILPVSKHPIFPNMMIPLIFSDKKSMHIIRSAYEKENRIMGIVLIKNEDKSNYWNSKLYEVGTVVKILKISLMDENSHQVLIQGLQRFTILRTAWNDPFLRCKVKYYHEPEFKPSNELKAYTLSVISSIKMLLKKNPLFQEQFKIILSQVSHENPSLILDLVASILNAEDEKLQDVLETFDLIKRSEKLLILLKEEIELVHIQEDIEKQIEEKISKQQREFFLREELRIIKKELGLEKDDKTAEIDKIKDKIRDLKLSEEASQIIHDELNKLKILSPSSPEFNVTTSYLNAIASLPWGIYSSDRVDLKEVRQLLNYDHYGLDDVKEMILQFISTIKKRGSITGSILCLVGPPGVGKTSVGQSIAHAMNRKFFRFSLGGMQDEAEIKGHRRTYIGAMPGKIMQSLKRCGTANPVIMLDEIDKIGNSYRGDPASALLEVLDPEQNTTFLDHYLDVHFDLSKILFITTANQLDTIPKPLLDRMEIIKLSGYILEEKVEIAKKFLIPKQLKRHGLKRKEIKITDKAISVIVDQYAREAGVRTLENQIKKIMRIVTLKLAEKKKYHYTISIRNLTEYLGKSIFTTETLYKKLIPGVTLGLAWTSLGGTTLYIEASAIKSKTAGFKQTGQLGNVMLESSEIAYSYIRSYLPKTDNENIDFFDQHFIHLHVPAGATPKDGPSAGSTMALALYSLAINKPVKNNFAMTGELTLTGKVLPIGGVKEKTIAARRVGISEIIFPKENKNDVEELPDYIKKGMTFHFVDYFKDILLIAYK